MSNVAFDNTRDYQIAQDTLGVLYIVQDGNWFSQKTQAATLIVPNGWKFIPRGVSGLAPGIQPQIILQGGPPLVLLPNGTVGANGAITLGTALRKTYSNGLWGALPVNAIFSGSVAGTYWCVMSSTTVGQVFQNTIPNGQPTGFGGAGTPWAGTSGIAYTQTTGTNVALLSIPILGATIGPMGRLRVGALCSNNNSAGAKTPLVSLGGSNIIVPAAQTTNLSVNNEKNIFANGATNSQVCMAAGPAGGYGVSASNPADLALDMTASQNLVFNGQLATATDFMQYDGYFCEAWP